MKNKKAYYLFACICLFSSGLSGCKTAQKTSISNFNKRSENFLENPENNRNRFKNVWIKRYDCEVRDNWKRKNFYGDIKIINGKKIAITVKSGFGLETARILITKDSVKIIDRVQKIVFCGGHKELKNYLKIIDSYRKAENLMLGSNMLIINEIKPDLKSADFLIKDENDNEIIVVNSEKSLGRKEFTVSIDNLRIKRYLEKSSEEETVIIEYFDWNSIEKLVIPEKIEIKMNKNTVNSSVSIRYKKIEINKELNINFRKPVGYKVINL